ncbi:dihydrolipoyl dehydrogenase [Desulfosarcina sp. OttesenSCG-928-A07]|nr:dihydrolipoyl dehydrogenase [Desulfosarcina sp. OttesenSCG-928-G17]MDL2328742.1 dihydrolipoyl dehydrogenase [Desulfosarcina sp. OttesenSCG-928-A07]
MTDSKTQVAVIGAGPGGYAAAFLAADNGMAVTLIDPAENPGGTCLYRGCMPSKSLLHVSRLITEAAEARAWGISFGVPDIDLSALRQWKTHVTNGLTQGLGRLMAQRKITYHRASAAFADPTALILTPDTGQSRRLTFDHAIVATGSSPAVLPLFPEGDFRIWNSTQALALEMIPETLLVVGGGYIGLELGSVYAALGTQVTVVEALPHLLAGADRDLVRFLQKGLTDRFEAILLDTTVTSIKLQEDGVTAEFSGAGAETIANKSFQRVLVAVGRRPHTAGLALENAGVTLDQKGFIRVNDQCRTTADTIFAVGDVAGDPMLAHKAAHDARIAVEAILGKGATGKRAFIPAVVFTDPEVAWVGLTETEAREKKISVETARFPWAASGRAATLGRSDGLTKMIIDPATKHILGVGIVGPGAGELIAEAVLAMEMGATPTDVGHCVHPHPTLSETLKEVADSFDGIATHYYRPKRKP